MMSIYQVKDKLQYFSNDVDTFRNNSIDNDYDDDGDEDGDDEY